MHSPNLGQHLYKSTEVYPLVRWHPAHVSLEVTIHHGNLLFANVLLLSTPWRDNTEDC